MNDFMLDEDFYCICGRAVPCRREGSDSHGLLSYYQREGPEQGGPIVLESEKDIIRAYTALNKRPKNSV